jgi:pilus assembly protein CpaE
VRGASRVTDALSRRYSRDKVSVVVSRYDKGAEILTRDIEEVVHVPVRFTIPSDYRLALQALNEGRPFVLAGNSKLATAVSALARQITGSTVAAPAATPPGPLRGWFGNLRWTTSA